jgi:hypothetical protein
MKLDDLVRRLDEIIAMGERALRTPAGDAMGQPFTDDGLYAEYKSAALSFLRRTFGDRTTYPEQFNHHAASGLFSSIHTGQGVLKAARGELAGGWIATTRGLVTAEVFADFLEMAEHLLEQQYKDAAAVMIGGTLEEHLRQLATANGIAVEELKNDRMVPRKAEAINSDLAKVRYEKLDQKNVTAWLDLRNKAAHAKYSEYNADQVRSMMAGVREFIARIRP